MNKNNKSTRKDLIVKNKGGLGVNDAYEHYSYLERGKYINQLKFWFQFIKREQFHIINSEELNYNMDEILRGVFSFLNQPEYKLRKKKKFNVAKYPKIDSHVRKKLVKYFEPYNQQLYDFLKKDFGWETPIS